MSCARISRSPELTSRRGSCSGYVLEESEAIAAALWIVHTHCIDAAEITPRLAVLSPTKQCGKTTLMKLLARLVHRPVSAANISAAAIFRLIQRDRPTLLIDEADAFLAGNEQLRGVLNAGHDRAGGKVVRVEVIESRYELVDFDPWGAVAIALIGRLPSTLADRAITLQLRRKTRQERIQRFRRIQAEALLPLARKCRRWANDNVVALKSANALEHEQLDARAADNWEPLFAIARAAGPEWERRVIDAAEALTSRARERERADDEGERLLADIRTLMDEHQFADRISMKELVGLLVRLEDASWSTLLSGRPMTTGELGKRLRTFGIQPRPVRIHGAAKPSKGYRDLDFVAAFNRYLGPRVTSVTQAESPKKTDDHVELQQQPVTGPESATRVNGYAHVTEVTEAPPKITLHGTSTGTGR